LAQRLVTHAVDSTQHTHLLASIVFAGIFCFPKMSSGDEVKALEISAVQKQIIQPLVLELGGQWLKESGEGCC
jgi:hypothetical protein